MKSVNVSPGVTANVANVANASGVLCGLMLNMLLMLTNENENCFNMSSCLKREGETRSESARFKPTVYHSANVSLFF